MNIKRVAPQLIALIIVTFISLIASTPGWAARGENFGPQAIIVNSGSTNTLGYRIYVAHDGTATYVDGNGAGYGRLSKQLTQRFFHDIALAQPLSGLPATRTCVKSVSFGADIYVRFGGQTSPDLSCAGNGQAQRLAEDVNSIKAELKVDNTIKRHAGELPIIQHP
jgi:hypothetical protein